MMDVGEMRREFRWGLTDKIWCDLESGLRRPSINLRCTPLAATIGAGLQS